MRILVDILHPAHVHFFRNFIRQMQRRGHRILVTARKKDIALDLLRLYRIPYKKISTLRTGFINLAFELAVRDLRMLRIARRFRPDVLVGVMGPSIATVGRLLGIPSIVFYNNEKATFSNTITYPLATRVITSSSYQGPVRGRHLTYKGYHETAYLHPKWFRPDASVLRDAGIRKGEQFFVVRTVSWQASHDIADKGFDSTVRTRRLMDRLSEHGRVLITSEQQLPRELELFRCRIPYHKMHSLLYYATMFIGESATMACEAALLGTPAIFVCRSERGYINELEKDYGLAYHCTDQESAEKRIFALLRKGPAGLAAEWKRKQAKLNRDCIDVTGFMADFIEKRKWERS